MNDSQVCLYADSGIKIFSKHPEDCKIIDLEEMEKQLNPSPVSDPKKDSQGDNSKPEKKDEKSRSAKQQPFCIIC